VPFVRPDTEHDVVVEVQLWPAFDVAVYAVIEEPPSDGAVQLTVVEAFSPDAAETPVGASGLVIAMMICGSSVIEMIALPSAAAVPNKVVVVPITE
jgi:hypothetical protein